MARAVRVRGRFANRPYNGLLIFALFQEETTGIVDAAGDVVEQAVSNITRLRDYLPDFIVNVLASLLVVFLGVVFSAS